MNSIFKRHTENPILTKENLEFPANAVFNAGAADLGDRVVLLLRVEDCTGRSHIRTAFSPDGMTDWQISHEALMHPTEGYGHEALGIEDCRINKLENTASFFLTYTAYSKQGAALGLASTKDFRTVERLGLTFPPENKNGVLFPKKIRYQYVLLHRPMTNSAGHIWIAYSSDLVHWGKSDIVIPARGRAWWDSYKVGAGLPPLETDAGWLLIYHGVKRMTNGSIYRIGAALLDQNQPHICIGRTKEYLMTPEAVYERIGDVPNVIFPMGGFIRGHELWLYYGAADSCVCLAKAPVDDVLNSISKI